MINNISNFVTKPVLEYTYNKGADQPSHPHILISNFVVHFLDSMNSLLSIFKKLEPLVNFCIGSILVQNQNSFTDLYDPSKKILLKIWKISSRVMRKLAFAYAKTKTQISFAVTAKLISAFVFTT